MEARVGFSASLRNVGRSVMAALNTTYGDIMAAMSPQTGNTLQRLTVSYRYNATVLGSVMFLLLSGLYAIDLVGYVYIWNHALVNALVWTVVGGLAWTMMYFTSFLNEVTGFARAVAEDGFQLITGENFMHGTHVGKRLSILASASISERRWIHAHMWATTALYAIGLGYLWRWWHVYRSLGSISMISNGIVLIEWYQVVGVLAVLSAPYLFLTLMALSSYQIAYHHTLWSAVGLLGQRFGVSMSGKAV